jgi:hypothetical protein
VDEDIRGAIGEGHGRGEFVVEPASGLGIGGDEVEDVERVRFPGGDKQSVSLRPEVDSARIDRDAAVSRPEVADRDVALFEESFYFAERAGVSEIQKRREAADDVGAAAGDVVAERSGPSDDGVATRNQRGGLDFGVRDLPVRERDGRDSIAAEIRDADHIDRNLLHGVVVRDLAPESADGEVERVAGERRSRRVLRDALDRTVRRVGGRLALVVETVQRSTGVGTGRLLGDAKDDELIVLAARHVGARSVVIELDRAPE